MKDRKSKSKLPLYAYQPAGLKADARAPTTIIFFEGDWKSGSPSQFEQQCKASAMHHVFRNRRYVVGRRRTLSQGFG
jgi:hypothetical protein